MKEQPGPKDHLSLGWDRPEFHCPPPAPQPRNDVSKLPVECLPGGHDLRFEIASFRTRLPVGGDRPGPRLMLRSCCSSLFFIKIQVLLGRAPEKWPLASLCLA